MAAQEGWSASILRLVRSIHNFGSENSSRSSVARFIVADTHVGWCTQSVAAELSSYASAFRTEKNEADGTITKVFVNEALSTPEDRTAAVETVLLQLRERGIFQPLSGWRNEHYAVSTSFVAPRLMSIERAAAPLFGIRQYGVHINGYVVDASTGTVSMWIGRRSLTKQTFPGLLDNTVAGGIAAGMSVFDTLQKECEEEAKIPHSVSARARAAGTVSYFSENYLGLCPETEFAYDLQLPSDFVPVNTDGEVSDFYLWTMDRIRSELVGGSFKPNCALIIVDFMVRWGILSPDSEPLYCEIVAALHRDIYS
eukprot:Opistho-2@9449